MVFDHEYFKEKMKNIGSFEWDITDSILMKYSISSSSIFFSSDQKYKIWMEIEPAKVNYFFNIVTDGIRSSLIGGTIGLLNRWNLSGIINGIFIGILSKIFLLLIIKFIYKIHDHFFDVLIYEICSLLLFVIDHRFIGNIGGLIGGLLNGTVGIVSMTIGEKIGGFGGALICLILCIIFGGSIKSFIDKIHKILFEQIIGICIGALFGKRFGGLLGFYVMKFFDEQKFGIKFNISIEDETRFDGNGLIVLTIRNKCMPNASQNITKSLEMNGKENSLFFALSVQDLDRAGVIQKNSLLNRMFFIINSTVYIDWNVANRKGRSNF